MTSHFNAERLQEDFEQEVPVLDALIDLIDELRKHDDGNASKRLDELLDMIEANPKLRAKFSQEFHSWLIDLNLYPALVSLGIFSRRGLFSEFMTRLYDKVNPPPVDRESSRGVLTLLFHRQSDKKWLATITPEQWLRLYQTLVDHTAADTLQTAINHFRQQCLYALEMLAIWVAAEELEPGLMRIDRRLVNIDSAFIGLQREVRLFTQTEFDRIQDTDIPSYDPEHIWVMLDQCHEQVARLRRKGAGAAGSSVSVAHLLERLEQTLGRIEELLSILITEETQEVERKSMALWKTLMISAIDKNSLYALMRNSIGMLSRSITQNKSDHGEHYISRDKSSFYALFRSAAGAGFIIALMGLLKISIVDMGFSPFKETVLVSLNYGLGFVLVHLLHFTIATKQPAMTAASFAGEVEQGENGRAAHRKLASLLIDVNRSQWAAVWGNVSTAIILAAIIVMGAAWVTGRPLLNPANVSYQLHAINPFEGLALFYAAIAGVWLFCSGIIAGYFDNRADYLEMELRLQQHPLLQWLKEDHRNNFAKYMHENSGAIAGNFFFGVLLGTTGYIGYLLNLPLDIRHVAFSSANLGYSAFSAPIGILDFLIYLIFVLMIGFVNLWVSFSLALLVALRSRGTQISRFSMLLSSIWEQIKENPVRVFFPVTTMQEALKEESEDKH
tara:strand:+ start:822 stop:2837 length:2016 start_codon:yes stop_codon:yes gene_type:complete